jgi:hypothetical protein
MEHLSTGSVRIPHHILTTWTEPWDFIKSSALYLSVHMEPQVYMVGTSMGFPVEIVEGLAPQFHHANPVEVPTVPYEYMFHPPSSD